MSPAVVFSREPRDVEFACRNRTFERSLVANFRSPKSMPKTVLMWSMAINWTGFQRSDVDASIIIIGDHRE
ncbi:unnamed protein product [Zymoseptoria tritici ST99CH_3D7]|uniref:Uncharacterized protein n=1 Tax=Zymoseptoria tritici (strain ST99CH_3D7) TaxID=1276538 RepID=A0A1X7S203_ZYMT9|nr:unnamed protein product [Zymoseptoria tritici ST99CH_3D7]